METAYVGRQFVGIDLHRRRSVIVPTGEAGEHLGTTRIDNDPFTLASQIATWGESPQVVLEATYGWYWAVDLLAEMGIRRPDARKAVVALLESDSPPQTVEDVVMEYFKR